MFGTLIQENLNLIGPPLFTENDKAFAKKTQAELGGMGPYAVCFPGYLLGSNAS